MAALVNRIGSSGNAFTARLRTQRLRRAAGIATHLLAWPMLVKLGLLTGFGFAALVQHLLALQP